MALEVEQRLQSVQDRLQEACRAHGRKISEVRLLAVSKTFPVSAIAELAALGQLDFGENYVQEASAKVAQMPDLRWHLIGPLQRNKARQAVELFSVIHSVDRLELAQRLENMAAQQNKVVDAFVQVRLGDEASKSGLDPAQLLSEMAQWNQQSWKHLRIVGLMSIPAPQHSRPYFAQLRGLRDELQAAALPLFRDYQLSMGMSDDFEDAIAEGSNWVRIGRALFGSR